MDCRKYQSPSTAGHLVVMARSNPRTRRWIEAKGQLWQDTCGDTWRLQKTTIRRRCSLTFWPVGNLNPRRPGEGLQHAVGSGFEPRGTHSLSPSCRDAGCGSCRWLERDAACDLPQARELTFGRGLFGAAESLRPEPPRVRQGGTCAADLRGHLGSLQEAESA